MDDDILLRLNGVDELNSALRAIPDVLRKRVLRNALAEGARVIRNAAKAAAPVLRFPSKRRKPGTIRENITVRTSKTARKAGDVGVFVGVRPLRGARTRKLGIAGASNPNDPYYWWWQEFGWTPGVRRPKAAGSNRRQIRVKSSRVAGKRFLTNAGQSAGPAAIDTFMKAVVPQIEKLNAKGALNVR